MLRTARFSEDGRYRYHLCRAWDESKPTAMCIGLNPSTANGEKDDATIRILNDTLAALGFGSYFMCNLYALITPKPSKLSESPDPLGDNDAEISGIAKSMDKIIFCWGAFPQAYYRAKQMKLKFPEAYCFGKNNDGSPMHPRALHYAGIRSEEVKLIKF